MCTITFIPHNRKAFITHNRDENVRRAKAVPPSRYSVNGCTLLYPKDRDAGGTWIAMNQNGNTAVLMNGGFTNHVAAPHYRKSRGIVLLELVATADMPSAFRSAGLEGIAPFTVILYNGQVLLECRWDGSRKHIRQHDTSAMHIWSSATLYDAAALAKRRSWFATWQAQHPNPTQPDIIGFHLHGGQDDLHNAIRMNRDGMLLTVSITAIEITGTGGTMKYFDLQDGAIHEQALPFIQHPVVHL